MIQTMMTTRRRWWPLLAVLAFSLGCSQRSEPPVRAGLDSALEEIGLGAWLEALYERTGGRALEVDYLDAAGLRAAVEGGHVDEVLLFREGVFKELEGEGLLFQVAPLAHEELVLIGPERDLLGKYKNSQGPMLLRNVARTNYRYLEGASGSVEGVRHQQLFAATGDLVKPGSWFKTELSGQALVRGAVEQDAFALVRRSSVLLLARDGIRPRRVWAEGDPHLTLTLVAGLVHPEKSGRTGGRVFHEWLAGPDGAQALERLGDDRLGHPIYALGAPKPGEAASTLPLKQWLGADQ